MRVLLTGLVVLVACANNGPGGTDRTRPDVPTEDSGLDVSTDVDLDAPDRGMPDDGTPDVGTPDGGTPDMSPPDMGTPDMMPPVCGGDREVCCAGDRCDLPFVCAASGFCATCGMGGEPCCAGGGCNAGTECMGGVCRGCGGPGETCCAAGTPCAGGNACVAGVCRACGVEPGTCSPGTREMETCGRCGTRNRLCLASCEYAAWSACTGERACVPGTMEAMACGNCGMQSRTCEASCDWGPLSMCAGEGTCEPGTVVTGGCEGPCQARECTSSCGPGGCDEQNPSCMTQAAPCAAPCPNGYHITRAACDTSCAAGCTPGTFVNRATRCEPDEGRSFRACMICNATDGCANACGPGYYVSSIVVGSTSDRSNCGLNDVLMLNCRKTTSSFRQCGTSCPAGYFPDGAPTRSTTTCRATNIEANGNIPNHYAQLQRCMGPGSP